ncbi:MAG: DNA gyrase subunit A, partial [Deltaproteobacteria bacterium]|nr:DNA gyrase subunit A [Deltaproteobacteria bacterium]
VKNIDEVVSLIKKSGSPNEAKLVLREKFTLTNIQAQAILDMRLQRLTGLERDKIISEYNEVLALIAKLKNILASETLIYGIIKDELVDLKNRFGDERRTRILDADLDDIEIEDLIQREEMVVTVSHLGYIKRLPVSSYRSQKRGGKGKQGMTTREEDFVEKMFTASTHDTMLAFTNLGRVHWIKVYQIPEVGRVAKGKPISNLIQLGKDEMVTTILPVKQFTDDQYVVFVTKAGTVKKTELSAYSRARQGGIIAITLKDDELVQVRLAQKGQDIIISTSHGQSIRFDEDNIRGMGRSAAGVRGITLKSGNVVVGMDVVELGKTILTVSEKGYGKRTNLEEYRKQSRGGSGILTLKVTERTGKVVCATQVGDKDDLMLISNMGKVIRQKIKDISVIGRNTQGVRLIVVDEDEYVVSAALIVKEDDDDENGNGNDNEDNGSIEGQDQTPNDDATGLNG